MLGTDQAAMNSYPNRERLVAVLLETARRAAMDTDVKHPEDIACAMSIAIEHAGIALQVAHEHR